jgi:hypothetical protein
MERKNFAGWLILSLLPLFAFIWMAVAQHRIAAARAPVDVAQVSAELARSVSYGFLEQPLDEAFGGDSAPNASSAAAPEHTSETVHQHAVLRPGTGL